MRDIRAAADGRHGAVATTSAVIESSASMSVVATSDRPTSTPTDVNASVRKWAASPRNRGRVGRARLAIEVLGDTEVRERR
jgi:hypothetical protein